MPEAETLRVSVVAPTHQRVVSLRRLLHSLEQQSLAPHAFEVIIVGDEGDAGEEVVKEFAARGGLNVRFSYVPDDPWRGRSPSLKRNHGARLAQADWLAFIDDDCVARKDWLAGAMPFFEQTTNGGVEGRKEIPPPPRPTLTYKGLLLFTRPRGYQTANMFYRRQLLLDIGGFDPAFPFYLEDTDLAWSVLDRGYEIPHADGAVVEHPVPPAEPLRLLANAKRAALMPYLYKKHPRRFREAGMRTLARSHYPYLALYALSGALLVSGHPVVACAALLGVLPLVAAHAAKLFWGCSFTLRELAVTAGLLPIVPAITLVQLVRGNLANGVLLLR